LLAQERQELEANAVAGDAQAGIGGILGMRNGVFAGEGLEGGFRLFEQWTDEHDFWIFWRRIGWSHAGEAFTSRAAQEAEKKQFHLVVRMMRQGDVRDVAAGGSAREKLVAHFARGHFGGETGAAREILDIGLSDNNGQPEGLGGIAHEAFVGIGSGAAQPVVQVGDSEPPAAGRSEALEQGEQHHGIQAAGNRDKDFLPVAEKLFRTEAGFEALRQRQVQAAQRRPQWPPYLT
jgi:hypothetical protein